MKKQMRRHYLILFLLPLLAVVLGVQAQEQPPNRLTVVGPGQRYTENIPVIDVHSMGHQPIALPTPDLVGQAAVTQPQASLQQPQPSWGGGSDPHNPFAVIRKSGPAYIQPGGTVAYEITLANYESITHTYQLTDTLPPQLTYVPDSAVLPGPAQPNDLVYEANTRTLSWQGELAPGKLDYVIEEHSLALPYLDLAPFGAVNLCEAFIVNGETCANVSVTFNLGVNGYTTNLYGEVLSQLTVSSNGLISGEAAIPSSYAHNQWLPDATTPGFVLAGLWRDVHMGGGDMPPNGRFHAAIVTGLIEGHDVFYAQWHDAPQAPNPDPGPTARHAIALLLNSAGQALADPAQTNAGHAFFIYDNISEPTRLVAQGYTIGVADKLGARGATYAYAPCCDDMHPPQGFPPATGTTLHLRPVLFGAENNYRQTFSYQAVVQAAVPEMVTNTAVATSSSPNPALAYAWSTHYLYVRQQTYIPLLQVDEATP